MMKVKRRTLRNYLRQRRLIAGLSTEELAAKVGVAEITIRRWETGSAPKLCLNQAFLHYKEYLKVIRANKGFVSKYLADIYMDTVSDLLSGEFFVQEKKKGAK